MTLAAYTLALAWIVAGFGARYAAPTEVARRRTRRSTWALAAGSVALFVATWAFDRHQESFALVVDSESALLGAITAIIAAVVITIAPRRELTRAAAGRILIWTACLQLIFHADNLLLLLGVWAASSLPFWSGSEPREARLALRRGSTHLAATSTLPLLAAVVWAMGLGGKLQVHTLHLSGQAGESGVLLLVLVAAAARMGIAPVHAWIPRMGRVLPSHVLVLASPLAGAYLLLRMSSGLVDAFVVDQPWLEAGGLFGALYFGLVAYGQHEQYRSAMYLGLSQVSLVFVAVCSTEALSVHGGMVLLISEAFAITGYVGCSILIRSRRGLVDLHQHHGLGMKAPILASLAFLFGLAVVGLPFSLTFVAEDIIAQGLLVPHPWLASGFVALTAINAIGMIRHYGRTFLGELPEGRCPDVRGRSRAGLLVLAVAVLFGGLAPQLVWSAEADTLGAHAPSANHQPK